MKKEKQWFSVVEVESQTGIPNQTIRRYINNHGVYLNPKKRGKGYFLSEESVKVIQEIRKLYDEGMTAQLVNDTLQERNIPMVITVSEGEQTMNIQVGEALSSMKKSIDEQNEVIRSLAEQMKKQQEYIDERLEQRDQRLIAAIRESQEVRREIAAEKEKKKKNWFTHFFKK